MAFNELEKVFLTRCEEYAKSINALGTKTTSEKKTTFFSISLSSIKLQFIYSKKRGAFDLPSTIFARVYLNKNTNHFYHIPELLAFLGIDDYRACYFPYIESEERMNCCFDAFTNVIDSHIEDFEKIVTTFRHEEMRRYQFESIKAMYSLKEEDYNEPDIYIKMLEMGETMTFLQRQTIFDAYYNLCCGKREEAIKKYEKLLSKNLLFDYEKRLLEFIKKPENTDFKPITDECFSYRDAKPYILNSNGFSFKTFAFSLGVTIPIFLISTFVVEKILSAGAIAYYGAPWWVTLLFGAVSALSVTIGFADNINKIVGDKKAKTRVKYRQILESKLSKDIGEVIFRSFSAILFVFVMMLSLLTTSVYDTYIKTPSDGNPFEMTQIQYEDVEKIYYMNARYNVYGDRIDRPSYVFILKDGTIFDFDMINTAEETEKDVLPLLEKYDLEIIKVDNHKEIPGYDKYYEENYE